MSQVPLHTGVLLSYSVFGLPSRSTGERLQVRWWTSVF